MPALGLDPSAGSGFRKRSSANQTKLERDEVSKKSSLLAFEPAYHVVELIETTILDVDDAALPAVLDADTQPKRVGHAPLQRNRIGALAGLGGLAVGGRG